MKLVIGIVIGALAYYYYTDEVETVIRKAEVVIHEGASKAAEVTKPKSEFQEMLDKVTDPLKGN